jgi:hypothetical protein
MLTPEDAQKIAAIAGTADHGCPVCVSDILGQLNQAFPEYRWEKTGRDLPLGDDDVLSPGAEVAVTPRHG